MQELTNQKTMTIKEIANVLSVSRELITKEVKKLFPEYVKKGKTTFLNELQVTVIKNNLVKKYDVETSLEKKTKINTQIEMIKAILDPILKQQNDFNKTMLEEIKQIKTNNYKQLDQPNKLTIKDYCLKNDLSSYNPKQLFIKAGRKAMELSKQLNRTVIFKKDGEYNVGCYDEDIVKHSVGIVLIEQDKERDLFNL